MAKIKTAATSSTAENGELLVYIGPNITRSRDEILLQFQTFTALPKQALMNKDLAALFVPLSGMAAARKELAVQGSRLYNIAKSVIAAQTQEGK